MRMLLTSNPLLGHWLPMLPLARAAQEAGHEVVIAADRDVVTDIERRGFSAWPIGPHLETIQAGLRDRSRAAAESDADRTVADGMAMFATRPSSVPTICWIGRLTGGRTSSYGRSMS